MMLRKGLPLYIYESFLLRVFEAQSGFLAWFGRLPAYVGSLRRRRLENKKLARVENKGSMDA